MTVWILHQKLTLEEEQHILEKTHLQLPFDGLPDLSMMKSPADCQSLLRALYPDEPPESISIRFDRIWSRFSNIDVEDVVAVPLPLTGKVAIGEISGPYVYQVGDEGSDVHLIPVKWGSKLYLFFAFGRQRHIFADMGNPFHAVTEEAARRAITSKLPYRYNRFTGWKWWWVWIFIAILVTERVYKMIMHTM